MHLFSGLGNSYPKLEGGKLRHNNVNVDFQIFG